MRRLLSVASCSLLITALLLVAACRSARQPEAARPTPSAAAPPVRYSAAHDADIEGVLDLARANRWDEAERRAEELVRQSPQDPALQRLSGWIKKEAQLRREKALEDEIRQIISRDSQFNPTLRSLATERKDRGLRPRKDLRDAVDQIESTPYVPDSYGRVIREKGPLIDLEEVRGHMAQQLEKEISVHLDDVTLEAIIFNIGQAHGINFVADKSLPAFQQKLSVNLERVKLSEFLNYVSRNLGVQFQVGNDLVWIVDGKDPARALEETRFYRLRRGFILPAEFAPTETVRQTVTAGAVTTTTETLKSTRFVPDQAPPKPSIEMAIRQFFQGTNTAPNYYIDYERNLIVARGTHEKLRLLEQIIEEFDRPVQQVLIEARFITVSEAAFLRLGMAWSNERLTVTPPGDQTGLAIGNLGVAPGFAWNWTNIFGVKDLNATLTALQQSGESQTLSAPRLTVVNNLPATINDGKVQYYYEEYQVKTTILERRSSSQLVPAGKPAKINSGASLGVMASVGGDGRSILLALNPRINSEVQLKEFAKITDTDDQGRVASQFEIKLPEYRTQDLSTRVVIRSGETVVMGGVLERLQSTYVESVPVLGNLPVLGPLFRRRTEVDRPRYLLIFVTATVLSDTGEFIRYED